MYRCSCWNISDTNPRLNPRPKEWYVAVITLCKSGTSMSQHVDHRGVGFNTCHHAPKHVGDGIMERTVPRGEACVVVGMLHHCQCTVIRRERVVLLLCKGNEHVLHSLSVGLMSPSPPRCTGCISSASSICPFSVGPHKELYGSTPPVFRRVAMARVVLASVYLGQRGLYLKIRTAVTAKCIAANSVLQKELKQKAIMQPLG